MSAPVVILRFPVVERRVGLCRNSIYSKLNKSSKFFDATFPKPVRISANAVGFIESEIDDWIEARMKARD